jgi:hypothetical protein
MLAQGKLSIDKNRKDLVPGITKYAENVRVAAGIAGQPGADFLLAEPIPLKSLFDIDSANGIVLGAQGGRRQSRRRNNRRTSKQGRNNRRSRRY